jgi:hypothetical protein
MVCRGLRSRKQNIWIVVSSERGEIYSEFGKSLSVSKLPLKCAVFALYSVVKQRLKCNTGKVCNCLIQFNSGSGLYIRSLT